MPIDLVLADDHALLREGLKALLAANGDIRIVGEAGDGREAVRLAQALKPDLLVMDISMPDLNGVEAVRLVREKSPQTKIIMLSMHSTAEHVYRALEAGASAYVLKESAAAQLLTAINTVYAGGRYLSPAIGALPPEGSASPLDSLSARERQVLQLVAEGRSSAEIGSLIHLSPKTVETYRSRLMKKLGLADVPALVKFALLHGLTPPA
jgi:DNA-binding NarL/FixJ family response regulator